MAGVEFATSTAANIAEHLIVESLLKPASRKLRSIFCFSNNVKHLKRKTEQLTSAQDRLQSDVEETKRQTQEIQKDVLDWLNAADEVQKDVQCLENEIQGIKQCCKWCPNWSYRYRLSKKVAKKTLVVTELVKTSKFEQLGRRATLPSIEFFSSKDFMPSKSSVSVLNKIRKAVDGDEVNMIGVCGMGGVGKTTLVKTVANKAKELKLFTHVVFVTVSQLPNLEKIQDEIADTLGLDFDNRSVQGKARQLWLRLIMEKKILIILDDVWKELDLMAIGVPFGEYHEGCKILVTTRNHQVCSSMRCQKKIQLDVLSEDESWDLFKRNACLDQLEDMYDTLYDVARDVARECKGLPLAVVTMSRGLRDKSLDEWIVTNQRLKNSRHLDNQHICEDIYSCLKLSYDFLKGEKLKSCFLSCSLFPEDYEISIEELTRHEVGRGSYEVNLIEDARREVRVLVKTLQNSGLLLDTGKEQSVKMHDVVRDFAHWLTSSGDNKFMVKSGLGMQEWPRSENFGCYKTISLMHNNIHNLPNDLECPKLETMLFSGDGSTRVSTTFFRGMSNLKVLTIESVFWLEGLQFLTNLQTLRLDKCELGNISSLGELKKLEILDFRGSGIDSLPDELGDLPSLKLLDLSDCQRLRKIPSNLLQRLSLLEELYFSGFSVQQWAKEGTSSEASKASLSELNSLSRLTVLSLNVCSKYFPRGFVFSKLERYGIFINRWYYGSYPASRTLQIKGSPLEAFKELFSNVEDLMLDGIIGYKNLNVPISDVQGRGLNSLTALQLQDCKDFECLIDTTQHLVPGNIIAFSNLVKITIMEMDCLKKLCNGQSPNSFLQKLQEVTVRKCKHMTFIVPALQNLKQVKIQECEKLQVVFQGDGHMRMKEGEGESMQLLSNLTCLDLDFLPELTSVWKCTIRHVSFQSLKMVRIQYCNKLTRLLSYSLAQSLVHLEEFEISHCSRLEHIINGLADQGEMLSQSSPGSLLCFPKLMTLGITDCSRLQYIFPIEMAQGLPSDGAKIVLPRLQSLVLENLTKLTGFYAENCFVTLPCLEKLEVRKCPHLTHFTVQLEVAEQSQLKRLCLSNVGKNDHLSNVVGSHWRKKSRNLEYMFIGDCEEIFHLQDGYFLSSLEALRLQALSDLQVIWKGPTNVENLQNLVCLVLSDCPKLKYVFPPILAQNLKQLSYLDIQECGDLEQIIAKDQISSSSSHAHAHLPGHVQPLCFPNLSEVCIKKCKKLKTLFPISVACHLTKLDCIIVEDVLELEQIFGHDDEADMKKDEEMMLLQLRELLLLKLPNFMSFSPMGHHFKFPILGFLTITDCPNMVTTFTVDSELAVHAKAKESNATRATRTDIDWHCHSSPTALPPFVEEP